MSNQVRTQNLRECTVQIKNIKTDAIVGTGVVVSNDGKIVTCGHVVAAAGVNPRLGRDIPSSWNIFKNILGGDANPSADGEVAVYFPLAREGETKERRARVIGSFHQHDDDVVLLQLIGGPAPVAEEHVARLGRAEESEGHRFRSYGYRRLEDRVGGWADGKILGPVDRPSGRRLQADPVQLESSQINRGMSGSAVLDMDLNLIVGIVSETWFPDSSTKDRDTAWAVNARVLGVAPLNLPLREEPYPLGAAPQPKTDITVTRRMASRHLGIAWNNAPPPIREWVGREDLLEAINIAWSDPKRRVAGLIGFGGEGKTGLARRWLDKLLAGKSQQQPDGVFWWSFYDKPNAVDEFFEAALTFMSRINPRKVPSADVRAQIVGLMLGRGRYVFVLDGLEALQHQDADQYGSLMNADFLEFVSYFAAPGHESFCLITSRLPVSDLMNYSTYTHNDVTRLSASEGRALLRKIGVKGADATLNKVVKAWDGHALTLGMLGGYAVDRHGGKAAQLTRITVPAAEMTRSEHVSVVLGFYNDQLSKPERVFLMLLSAFRRPVDEAAITKVFRTADTNTFNSAIVALDKKAFDALIKRLAAYRILRYETEGKYYTAHPLIRSYFLEQLESSPAAARAVHNQIKEFYLGAAGTISANPTLDDLAPLIEAVHHACQGQAYHEACRILHEDIYRGEHRILINKFGAYDMALALMEQFFQDGDTSTEPRVSKAEDQDWMLDELGLCHMNLGRLDQAAPFFERKNSIAVGMEAWRSASRGHQHLAELYAYMGRLKDSAEAADRAVDFARRHADKSDECVSLCRLAWTCHLQGESDRAFALFQQAEALQKELAGHGLYSQRGIQYADHLRRTGRVEDARQVTEANLEICKGSGWVRTVSQCHRLLGELDSSAGNVDDARRNYDKALELARSISHLPALIEVLLARGRWASQRESDASYSDLEEALSYAITDEYATPEAGLRYAAAGGYRIYETDIRVALGWTHLAAKDLPAARSEAEQAKRLSAEIGYHWGQLDSAEILSQIG